MRRRTIHYLGTGQRLLLDDAEAPQEAQRFVPCEAGECFPGFSQAHQIRWHIKPEELVPWTIGDTVNHYPRRTLEDLIGINSFPPCHRDRPSLSQPLWLFLSETGGSLYRAFLLLGKGKPPETRLLQRSCGTLVTGHGWAFVSGLSDSGKA